MSAPRGIYAPGLRDGEDWAAARVAELRAAGEDGALVGYVRTQVGLDPLGPFHWHGSIVVVVLRGDGKTIERQPTASVMLNPPAPTPAGARCLTCRRPVDWLLSLSGLPVECESGTRVGCFLAARR